MKKRLLLSAAYSAIEPLGLMHLAGLARDVGWEVKISLVKDHDFARMCDEAMDFQPDLLGFNIYTGNHVQTFGAIDIIKEVCPKVGIIVGGPHPTYFPMMAAEHADYVVMSEGFHALKKILDGTKKPGIHPYTKQHDFPQPARDILYKDYPEFAKGRIKSMIGLTGCPYKCTYCYNSSTPDDIEVSPEIAAQIAEAMGKDGRLFPFNQRSVASMVREVTEIRKKWPETEVLAFVDDIHGFDTKGWMSHFATAWKHIGIPYSSQMRWEMVNGDGGKRRLDLVRKAKGFSLTLAIESANDHVRKEVLDRATPESLMFEGMKNIRERGFRVRTEQITGLPYGATTRPSPVNLEADLELVELNVRLKPDIAWASTFAPYVGTKLAAYAKKHGHYDNPGNFDVPDTFFERSVLRFPIDWIGPGLHGDDPQLWLNEKDQNTYRDKNRALRDHFNNLCTIPEGHVLARQWLEEDKPTSASLNARLKHHLYDEVLYKP